MPLCMASRHHTEWHSSMYTTTDWLTNEQHVIHVIYFALPETLNTRPQRNSCPSEGHDFSEPPLFWPLRCTCTIISGDTNPTRLIYYERFNIALNLYSVYNLNILIYSVLPVITVSPINVCHLWYTPLPRKPPILKLFELQHRPCTTHAGRGQPC